MPPLTPPGLMNSSYNYDATHSSILLQLGSHNSGISNKVSYVAELQVAPEKLNLVKYISVIKDCYGIDGHCWCYGKLCTYWTIWSSSPNVS